MPSHLSWQPAPTTAQIVEAVGLSEHVVLRLLHELHVADLAVEAGGRWRRRTPPDS